MKFEWQKAKWGILILVSTTFILLCGSFLFNRFASSSAEMVLHTMDVKASAERLMRNVVDAESSQRGFIITQNERFLGLYKLSKDESLHQLQYIKFLIAENYRKGVCLTTLKNNVVKKFAELDETISLVKEQKHSEALTIISSESGKLLMDEIRKTLVSLLAEEDTLLKSRTLAADQDQQFATVFLLLSIFSFVIFAANQLRKFYQKNKDLVVSNEKLDEIIRDRTQALEQEKNRVTALLQDVTHRVGNNLAMISAIIGVQIRKSDNDAVKTALLDARVRISAIAAGQRRLQLDLDTDEIKAKPYLENLLLDTQQIADERGLTLKYVIEDIFLPGKDAVSYIVLANELTTNSLKHGFPDGMSGEILVTLTTKTNCDQPFIELSVEDNGVGKSLESKYAGLGHSIIQSLLKSMNATLETNSLWPEKERKGYRSVIKIPFSESVDLKNL